MFGCLDTSSRRKGILERGGSFLEDVLDLESCHDGLDQWGGFCSHG